VIKPKWICRVQDWQRTFPIILVAVLMCVVVSYRKVLMGQMRRMRGGRDQTRDLLMNEIWVRQCNVLCMSDIQSKMNTITKADGAFFLSSQFSSLGSPFGPWTHEMSYSTKFNAREERVPLPHTTDITLPYACPFCMLDICIYLLRYLTRACLIC